MRTYRKIVTPYLTGQRRDGLCRVRDIDCGRWEVVLVPEYRDMEIWESVDQMQRMGRIYSLLAESVREAVSEGSVPVSVAGDCVSALGVLAGLQRATQLPDRILWLDAHGDFHTWETTRTNYIGGMPLAMLVGRGDQCIVDAVGLRPYPEGQVILADARDCDPGEREAIEESGIVRCGIADIAGYVAPEEKLYLHWDTDMVDAQAEMPALKYHVRWGPPYSEIGALFRRLRDRRIIAISVSAWHEERDRDNRTAIAALKLLAELGVDVDLSW